MQAASLSLSPRLENLSPGEAFLKFQLAPQVLAMVSARLVQEATVIPASQITAMPNMPACMLGLINRRGQVMWVANLVRVMGLPLPEYSSQQWNLIVVKVGTFPLALQVESIEGIVTLPEDAMQPPPNQVNSLILPYLKGCLTHRDENVLVLDVEAILQSSALQNN